jgi:hypothetical protein
MSLIIKSDKTISNPVAIELAARSTCISHYLFGEDAQSSLTNRVTGEVHSNLGIISIDVDNPKGARFNTSTTLTTQRAKSGLMIVDLNNTGNISAFYGLATSSLFELSGQTNGSLAKTLAMNIRGTNVNNVTQVRATDSTTNGTRFFVTRFNLAANTLELLYFVNDVLKKLTISTADPLTANPASALAHNRINAITDLSSKYLKWYELGLLDEVISDSDVTELYTSMKKSYARLGISLS